MARLTKPEKWKDTFFLNLKPIDKLVFIYIYENCCDAGFFDVNFNKMVTEIGITNQEISKSLKNLEKTFLTNINSDKIWLRKFLLHQNKLPLDLKTNEGNYIKFQIEGNLFNFNNNPEMSEILKNIKKKTKSKALSEFIKPTVDEVIQKFRVGDWAFIQTEEIISIYDYYESVGWKVGNKKMVDWNKSFIGCFRRNIYKRPRPNSNSTFKTTNTPNTKLEMIIQGNEKIKNFDFNVLKQQQTV